LLHSQISDLPSRLIAIMVMILRVAALLAFALTPAGAGFAPAGESHNILGIIVISVELAVGVV
jgi:hypothetical protein